MSNEGASPVEDTRERDSNISMDMEIKSREAQMQRQQRIGWFHKKLGNLFPPSKERKTEEKA